MNWNGKFIIVLAGKDYGAGHRLQKAFEATGDSWWYLHVENVSHYKAVEFIKIADALIAIVPENSTGTSKIAHYIGANKPIIVIGENIKDTVAELITAFSWGIVTDWSGLPHALDELAFWASYEHKRRLREFEPTVIKKYPFFGGHMEIIKRSDT